MPVGAALLFRRFQRGDTHRETEESSEKFSLRVAFKTRHMPSHSEKYVDLCCLIRMLCSLWKTGKATCDTANEQRICQLVCGLQTG